MSRYWTALQTLNQVAAELGLPQVATVLNPESVQSTQLLAMLNSAGNELVTYYPWEQLKREWAFDTLDGVGDYALPDDWCYNLDQTQWDRTNHWPLIGPKSAQEWAWLKGGLLAAAPRIRFRIQNNLMKLWPIPSQGDSPGVHTISQEYVSRNWVQSVNDQNTPIEADMVTRDADVLQFDPWLLVKYVKYKFFSLKGFDTTDVQADFMRIFNSLTGKDVGAPVLNLAPRPLSQYLGPWSVPDGSWNVGQP